jgi:hypothetical protein
MENPGQFRVEINTQFAARRIDRRTQSARWVGSVRPQYSSYSLEIRYGLGTFPEARVKPSSP